MKTYEKYIFPPTLGWHDIAVCLHDSKSNRDLEPEEFWSDTYQPGVN